MLPLGQEFDVHDLIYYSQHPCEKGSMITPILQMKRLWLSELGHLVQGHTASEWQNWDPSPTEMSPKTAHHHAIPTSVSMCEWKGLKNVQIVQL